MKPFPRIDSPLWSTVASVVVHLSLIVAVVLAIHYGWMAVWQIEQANQTLSSAPGSSQSPGTGSAAAQDRPDPVFEASLDARSTTDDEIRRMFRDVDHQHHRRATEEHFDEVHQRLRRLDAIDAVAVDAIQNRVLQAVGQARAASSRAMTHDPQRPVYRVYRDGMTLRQLPDESDFTQLTPQQLNAFNAFDGHSAVPVDMIRERDPDGTTRYWVKVVDRHGTAMFYEDDPSLWTRGDLARFRLFEMARDSPNLTSLIRAATSVAVQRETPQQGDDQLTTDPQ